MKSSNLVGFHRPRRFHLSYDYRPTNNWFCNVSLISNYVKLEVLKVIIITVFQKFFWSESFQPNCRQAAEQRLSKRKIDFDIDNFLIGWNFLKRKIFARNVNDNSKAFSELFKWQKLASMNYSSTLLLFMDPDHLGSWRAFKSGTSHCNLDFLDPELAILVLRWAK